MNQTQDSATGATDAGPNLDRESVRTLNRLRRSREDRMVAGVAGGLGRHFGIDPTIVRVALIALTIVGGAGLLLYAAVWLFVPEDGADGALIHLGDDLLKVVLIGVGAIAVLSTLGSGWWWGGHGRGFPWQLGLCALIVAVVVGYANKRHREEGRTESHTEFHAPARGRLADGGPPGTTPGAYAPASAPSRPPRPRRTGVVLFWPTLALVLVGCGALGIYAADHHVVASAWPALALAIIGVMLVIGAFVGRPGGLILIGLLTIPALLATSAVENFSWENDTVDISPANAAAVRDHYGIGNGKLVIDLTEVYDPRRLAGRTIDVSMDIGEVVVHVPRNLDVAVDGSLDAAGDVEVGNRERGGINPEITRTLSGGGRSAGLLTLDVHGRFGHIEVTRGPVGN